MQKNILEAYNSIYQIENGALRRTPTISRWSGYFMAHIDKWYFAYTITTDADGNVSITVVDSCHQQNMHESTSRFQNKIIKNKQYNTMKNTRNKVRLTESQLHQVIKELINEELTHKYGKITSEEIPNYGKDEYYQEVKTQNTVPNEVEYMAQRLDTFLKKNIDNPYGWNINYQVQVQGNTSQWGDESKINLIFRPLYSRDLLAFAEVLTKAEKLGLRFVVEKCSSVGITYRCYTDNIRGRLHGGRNTNSIYGRKTDKIKMDRERKHTNTNTMTNRWYPS